MGTAMVTLPDGRKARVTFDTQEQLDATVDDLTSGASQQAPTAPKKSPGVLDNLAANFPLGYGEVEPALAAGSGMLASIAGAGASAYGLATAPPGLKARTADEYAKKVASALTYQPRTAFGKLVTNAAAIPGELLSKAGDKTADAVFDATGNKYLAAGADVALQGAVNIAGGKLVSKGLGAVTSRLKSEPIATAEQAQAAESYATSHGLDWDTLPPVLKKDLAHIAADPEALAGLDPQQAARAARLEKLQVPATRANITRNTGDITAEESFSKADIGQPIRDIKAAQDTRLHGLLDTLRSETGATAETRQALGKSVQGAERAKLASLKATKTLAYKEARDSGETAAPAEIAPLEEFLSDPTNRRNAGYLRSAIDDYAQDGQVSINHLEEIRKEANANVSKGGPEGYFAKKAVKVIDGILDDSGGDIYKKARAAHAALKTEFDRQGRVKKLVTEKGYSTDRAVALEDTFDNVVLRGSAEELGTVKKSLTDTKAGSGKTRAMGQQAFKDLQGATIDYLKEKAAGKRAIPGENEQLPFNSAFREAFSELDKDGKVDLLFSKQQASLLRELYKVVGDVRTTPATRISGSDTVPRSVAAVSSLLDQISKLPITNVGKGLITSLEELRKKGFRKTQVQKAVTSPISEAARAQAKARARAAPRPRNEIPLLLQSGQGRNELERQ